MQNKIPVLDSGFVQFIEINGLGNPDLFIVEAARASFNNTDMTKTEMSERDKKLLAYLVKNLHTSPIEHVSMTVQVRAPLVVWWQWVRHRTMKYGRMSMGSGRYTQFQPEDFLRVAANEWRLQSNDNKQASDGYLPEGVGSELTNALNAIYSASYTAYEAAIKYGVAREQARLFLPGFSMYYTAYVTMDLHNLMHFISLREANDAQYEIRQYADALAKILENEAPLLYGAWRMYQNGND